MINNLEKRRQEPQKQLIGSIQRKHILTTIREKPKHNPKTTSSAHERNLNSLESCPQVL